MSSTIQNRFTIIGKYISNLFTTSFTVTNNNSAIKNTMGGRKKLCIFKDHFNGVFVVVHFSTLTHIMVKVKNIHVLPMANYACYNKNVSDDV